jgi:hypothetical protein
MTLVLARVPALRMVRTPRAWLPILLWAVVALGSAVAARTSSGAGHAMRGSFAFLVMPLVAYAIVGAVASGAGLRHGIRGVVALGAAPLRAALASLAVAVVFAAGACGVLAAFVCVLAHGSQDPPLATDVPISLWVGALGGGAYAAFFCAGSAIGKGRMRSVLLAFDWIVGSGAGVGAIFTPRGHVLSLLGGLPCAELSQRASSLLLVALLLAYAAVTLLLIRRA